MLTVTERPTYVVHPANLDEDEAWMILFKGPEQGFEGNTQFFNDDGRRTARLIAALSTTSWFNGFVAELRRIQLTNEHDDYFGSDPEPSVEGFVGEPLPTATLDLHVTAKVEHGQA